MSEPELEDSALRDFLGLLRRRLGIILAGVGVVTSSALGFSLIAEDQYTATAKLLFRDPGFDQKLFGSTVLGPSQDPAREAATNVGLVSLDTISARAVKRLDDPRLTASKIRDKVEVTSQGQSDVVSVKATDTSPRLAARLANTIADQYIVFRRNADRSKILEAASLQSRQLAGMSPQNRAGRDGRAVKQQIQQLRTLASLQTGNAERVQAAAPPHTPSAPKPVRNAILGVIAGLALGIGLAFLIDRLDRRLRHRGDAEFMLGRPVLGSIPDSRALREGTGDSLHLGGLDAESFRTLRTNLRYFDVDKDVHSLLVTSSAPGDGKTTVSRYLGATAAASHVRVVLVEADLRRPTLEKLLGLRSTGLTDVLTTRVPLSEVIQQVPIRGSDRQGEGPTLDVVVAGAVPPNPSDLLESDRMRTVLAELEHRYDLVIVDTSPVTVVSDAIPLMGRVSGVAIVIREGKSMKSEARKLRKQLDNLKISPLGIIINGAAPVADYSYYGYAAHSASPNGAESRDRRSGDSRRRLLPSRDERPTRRITQDLQSEELAAPAVNEHEIDQVLLALADGSYVLSSPDGSVVECGVGVLALLGSPAEQLVGRPTMDVLLSGADADARAAFERLPQAERLEPSSKRTFSATALSGAELSLEFVVVAVPLALGWEFTSLLSELGSRDTGTWEPEALRLRHGRALETIGSVCSSGAQPDPGGRLAGILIVVRDADAQPLTREDVGRRMADKRAAQRAAAEEAARLADAELGHSMLDAAGARRMRRSAS